MKRNAVGITKKTYGTAAISRVVHYVSNITQPGVETGDSRGTGMLSRERALKYV